MKTKKILVFGILGLAFFIGSMNLHLSINADCGNELILNNIEALAQGEGSEGGCYGTGSVICGHGSYYGKWEI